MSGTLGPICRRLSLTLPIILLLPLAALAETEIENFTYSAATTTRFPLPFPSGSVATTFTSYTATAFPYAMGDFYVGTTGNYSVTVGGIAGGVGIFVVEGAFAPSAASDPSTPLANVLAGTQAPATIPSITLQAGVQYTYLVVVSSGSGSGSVTVDGGGCVAFDPDTCALAVPTLSTWALILLALFFPIAVRAAIRRQPEPRF